ncbi:hypothetical protein I4F81_000616 [Pyropia yezoensis]|uniref:Uncharacterized protein n=1 Tax=Pyropia yezoensis TaxID=2788 RepID=A0ACC3BJB3_PYRYE|nr:hypothetical protein I4F81_000616 [Neopyropia yezoensis]
MAVAAHPAAAAVQGVVSPLALSALNGAVPAAGLWYVNYVVTRTAWALPLVLLDPPRVAWVAAITRAWRAGWRWCKGRSGAGGASDAGHDAARARAAAADEAAAAATAASAAAPRLYQPYKGVGVSLLALALATVAPLVAVAAAAYHLASWNVWRGAHSVLYLCGLDALGWSLGIRHTLAVGLYLVRGFWPGVAVAAALLGGGIAARRTLIRRYGPVVAYGCVTDLPPPPAEGDDADDGGASGAGRHADLVARALTAYLPPPLRPLPPLPEALVAAAAGK